MRVDITEYEKTYSFELFPITQLCGQNVVKKTYLLESIRRYFGTYKYQEGQDKWRENVKIDDTILGRKYFAICSISKISDILDAIKCSKQSLMMEYLKQLIQKFELQKHMDNINNELEEMFQLLNEDIHQLGQIELDYAMSDIWDMVQKSEISGNNQTRLDNKNNYELIVIMLNLMERVMNCNPKKQLVLFENIDHFLTLEEYAALIQKLKNLVKKYDIHFILTTSLEGYAECDKDLVSGIAIFGETDFQMPDFGDMLHFIGENYPCNKEINEEEIKEILKKIIQRIGRRNYLCSPEENVICKMINQTLLLHEKINAEGTKPEMAFLKS